MATAPVDALTLQRTWWAKVGSNGANGMVTVKAYTNGVGSASYNLRGLRANATYIVQVRKGTCANLGSVTTRLPAVQTSATGTVRRADNLMPWVMTDVWSAARKPTFVVRLVSGSRSAAASSTSCTPPAWRSRGFGIDLPVIRGPAGYPPCRVAMYHASVAQPREPGVTFIYAHARTGMFLPLLTRWRNSGGASLIGRTVKVWTSDSYVSYYRINKVRTTTKKMTGAYSLAQERLWLQTSTGPNTTYPKLIVEAVRYSTVKSSYAAAHPKARPVRC